MKEKSTLKTQQNSQKQTKNHVKKDNSTQIQGKQEKIARSNIIDNIFKTAKKTKQIKKQSKTNQKQLLQKKIQKQLEAQWKLQSKMRRENGGQQVVGPTQGRMQNGLKIYSQEELKIGKGGNTPKCPIDCDCCF